MSRDQRNPCLGRPPSHRRRRSSKGRKARRRCRPKPGTRGPWRGRGPWTSTRRCLCQTARRRNAMPGPRASGAVTPALGGCLAMNGEPGAAAAAPRHGTGTRGMKGETAAGTWTRGETAADTEIRASDAGGIRASDAGGIHASDAGEIRESDAGEIRAAPSATAGGTGTAGGTTAALQGSARTAGLDAGPAAGPGTVGAATSGAGHGTSSTSAATTGPSRCAVVGAPPGPLGLGGGEGNGRAPAAQDQRRAGVLLTDHARVCWTGGGERHAQG